MSTDANHTHDRIHARISWASIASRSNHEHDALRGFIGLAANSIEALFLELLGIQARGIFRVGVVIQNAVRRGI